MKQFLYKAFHIERNESVSILLLITQSFFLGVFYGALDIAASALFLKAYPAAMLPKAFVISGIAGIIMTGIYTQLQKRISFKTLAVFNLIFITATVILLRAAYYFTASTWLSFAVLVLLGPLNIIALLGFWGVAGRVFTLRQGKRLFGLIDSGQVFGVIISSYAIPIILIIGFSTINLLYICSISAFFALILQIIITKRLELESDNSQTEKKDIKNITVKDMFRNKFILYMSVFVTLSMMSAFFVYYSFLDVTNAKYPDADELAKFLGVFTGTLMVFSFIFKTFIYSKIMQTYNLRTSLLVLPVLLFLLSSIAIVIGLAFGYTAETSGFLLFFMLIALSRLFSRSLKESLEAPSFKILYLTLNQSIRYDVQARIDGVVNEFAALFSGIILAGLGLFQSVNSIHYVIILMIILLVWIFIAVKLYSEYKNTLIKSLYYNKTAPDEIVQSATEKGNSLLLKQINSENIDHVFTSLKILEFVSPIKYDSTIGELLKNENEDIRFLGLKIIHDRELLQYTGILARFIKSEKNSDLSGFAEKTRDLLSDRKIALLSKDQILALIQSKEEKNREQAAKIIGLTEDDIFYPMLIALLRDHSYYVRTEAIKVCAKIKLKESFTFLIDCLSDPKFSNHATDALITIGKEVLDPLEIYFYKSDIDINVQIKYIKIIGKIGGDKAIAYLINKLNYPVRKIAIASMNALAKQKFSFEENYNIPVRYAIDLTISVIGWDLNIIENIKTNQISAELTESLQDEVISNYQILYNLLGILYDSEMISTVRENIENGSGEGVSYALELLDLYVSDDLKLILFPLFENISASEKIKKLQDFFAFEKYNTLDLLYAIIQRDCNLISRWTKTLAIRNLLNIEQANVRNELLAHLFNNDKIIFETAGIVVSKLDPEHYNHIGTRLDPKLKNDLDYLITMSGEKKVHSIFDRVHYLKSISVFKQFPHDILIDIAEKAEEILFRKKEIIINKKNKSNNSLFVFISGEIAIVSEIKRKVEFLSIPVFTENNLLHSYPSDTSIISIRESEFLCINNENYQTLLSENNYFFDMITEISGIPLFKV